MISLVYGMPGVGKTTWMHDFLLAHPEHLFFVVDHAAEWGPDAAHWRGAPPQIVVVEAKEALPEDYPEAGVYVFRGREPYDIAELCVSVGNATYVDDEIDIAGRKGGFQGSALQTMVHRGRHAENARGEFTQVNVVGACRRPQSLHTDLTDLVDQVCIFRVQGKRTLNRLEEDAMLREGDWEKVSTLPKFHFLHWPSGDYLEVKPVGKPGEDANGGSKEDGQRGQFQQG